VAELTVFVDLSSWSGSARLIMCRERPHPGAQLTLFDTSEGFRHTCFITNTADDDICTLELRHRGYAILKPPTAARWCLALVTPISTEESVAKALFQ
jgi:hypothetical protein